MKLVEKVLVETVVDLYSLGFDDSVEKMETFLESMKTHGHIKDAAYKEIVSKIESGKKAVNNSEWENPKDDVEAVTGMLKWIKHIVELGESDGLIADGFEFLKDYWESSLDKQLL